MAQNPPPTPPPLTGLSKSPDDDMLEAGENIITIVRRSAIGLAGIYLVAFLAVFAVLALVISIEPGFFNTDSAQISTSLMAIFVVSAVLLVLVLYAATFVYRQSRLLI